MRAKLLSGPKQVLGDLRSELRDSELRGLIVFASIILATGTIFYMIVEGWGVIEAFYFSVTVLTTVGFGDLHPTTDLSRLFTSVFMLTGIGFVLGLVTVGARVTSKQLMSNRSRGEDSN